MFVQFYDVPSTGSPTEIVSVVDADYEVIVTFDSDVQLGGAAMTGNGFGDGGCRFQSGGVQIIKLKPGDALYAMGVSAAVEVGVFAQPC